MAAVKAHFSLSLWTRFSSWFHGVRWQHRICSCCVCVYIQEMVRQNILEKPGGEFIQYINSGFSWYWQEASGSFFPCAKNLFLSLSFFLKFELWGLLVLERSKLAAASFSLLLLSLQVPQFHWLPQKTAHILIGNSLLVFNITTQILEPCNIHLQIS